MGHMTAAKNMPMEGAHCFIMFGLASGVTTFVPTKRLLYRIVIIICRNNKSPQFT
jgi:hypothetical protein